MDFNLQDIEAICGISKKQGDEHVMQCAICSALGGDKYHDNLKYNSRKHVVWCHADPSHAPLILSEIMKKKERPMQTQPEVKQWMINKEEYILYWNEVNDALMSSDKALNYLFEHKRINPFTVQKTGLGYDFDDNKWVFACRDMNETIKGFRYRGGDLTNKTIWSERDTGSFISLVYGNNKNENLYICEGEWDALSMVQMLDKADKLKNSTVVTPTMGVGNLEKCITDLNFDNFKNIYLNLDNDIEKRKIIKKGQSQDVSLRMTKKLIEKYPFMVDKTPQFTDEQLIQGNKDISDWMRLNY